jgi:hypothetical protein
VVLFRNLLVTLFKLSILLLVITFEKVVGLPLVFVTLLLIFFTNEQKIYRYFYLILGSIFLAVVYGISFSFSLLILVLLVLVVNHGHSFVNNDINRILFSIYGVVLVVAISSHIVWGSSVVWSMITGSVLMFILLMKTLFARRGLATNYKDKKGSFFR